MTFKDLVLSIQNWNKYLLSKWITIVGLGILGGVCGLIYGYLQKPTYKATTTFVLEESGKGEGLGQMSGLASMVGIDLNGGSGGIFQSDNIPELYKSRAIIQKVLLTEVNNNGKKELLVDRFISFNHLREEWDKKADIKNIQFKAVDQRDFKEDGSNVSRLQDSLLGKVVSQINDKYLTVSKLDKKSSIIKVEVSSKDEFFAKNFNEQIVKNVNDFYVQTKTKKSADNIAIMQHKTDSVRAVMNGAIFSSAEIADATPNINVTRQARRIAPMQRSQFTAETNKAILNELVKNLEISKMSLLKEMPLIQIVDVPVYPLEKEKIGVVKGFILGTFITGMCVILFLLFKKVIKDAVV